MTDGHYYTIVISVQVAEDEYEENTAHALALAVQDAVENFGTVAINDWCPDPDTVADGLQAPYENSHILDLNPGSGEQARHAELDRLGG